MATVAIFHALDVDPILNMLVFGESILNDAISIVLTASITQSANVNAEASTGEAMFSALKTFCAMFFASAGIGVIFALISALLLKHIDLRKHPSLEFAMMLMFTYAPYVLAEGIHLSGISMLLTMTLKAKHFFNYRYYGYTILRNRHVPLHAFQPIHCKSYDIPILYIIKTFLIVGYPNYHAADDEDTSFHC